MYCSNCGEEVTGKFCSECGTPVITSATESAITEIGNTDIIISRNGLEFNITEITNTYGKNRIHAIKHLVDTGSFSLKEAKEIIDESYRLADLQTDGNEKSGFWARAKEQAREQQKQNLLKKQQEREHVAQLDKDGIPYCPKCYSTSLSAHKKGFGLGKAAAGALLAGPIGLAAGGIGSGKVKITCLKCGHQFKPGK